MNYNTLKNLQELITKKTGTLPTDNALDLLRWPGVVKEMTLTDYLVSLIKTDAPKTLKAQTEITLTNEQFDNFLVICNSDRKPSKQIRKAADLLDKEGF